MNIIKEKIKLTVAYPEWRTNFNKLKNNNKKKIILIGSPMHGNLGDHAIALQEQYFFEDYFPDYDYCEILTPMYHTQKEKIKKLVDTNDLIIISGGGWMGNLWLHNENIIREVVKSYPMNKIIILPQTIYYTSDKSGENEYKITKEIFRKHNNLHIFVREKKSYDFIKNNFDLQGKSNVYLSPDMVLYGKKITTFDDIDVNGNNVINVCIREDCESEQEDVSEFFNDIEKEYEIQKISTVIKSPVILKNRVNELTKSWTVFKNAKITITDRLHAMIFSILNGTPCIILDNKTGKVFGVSEWVKDTNMVIKVNSLKEAVDKLNIVKMSELKPYDRNNLLPYFKNMADIIRKD